VTAAGPSPAGPVVEVVRPGLVTTVQDLGRPGHGRFGVSASGAMDRLAHRLASRLVGNAESAAALELTGAGCELLFLGAVRFALAGADLDAALDGQPLPALVVADAAPGSRLQLRQRRQGARATLALAGGLDVPLLLGSAATDTGAGLGGVGGRPLRAGQRLAVHPPQGPAPPLPSAGTLARLASALPVPGGLDPGVLRVVLETDPAVAPAARDRLASAAFCLSSQSGRTGYRLEGEPLPATPDRERLSEPTAPGLLQLPPDGLPILLMADANTIGGYPRLGHLASADRSRAAQLWPGDPVLLRPVTLDEATRLARSIESHFRDVIAAVLG
jgi:biotin-dependent carboxylase-like uncharacterized protein